MRLGASPSTVEAASAAAPRVVAAMSPGALGRPAAVAGFLFGKI
jgi:hypothetical protein